MRTSLIHTTLLCLPLLRVINGSEECSIARNHVL